MDGMKIGCCLPGTFRLPGYEGETTIVTALEQGYQFLMACGYDFMEFHVAGIVDMTEDAFAAAVQLHRQGKLTIEACNCFIPGSMPLTGPDRDQAVIREYLEKALTRMSALGGETVVFGSGGARNVPEGYPFDKAIKQVANFLQIASEYAEKYQVDIAIEPLRRQECNIVNLVSEAMILAAWVDSPRIGVLADTFHVLSGHEPWSTMSKAGKRLFHVHISQSLPDMSGRIYPKEGDGNDYEGIFAELQKMGYEGSVSIEAGCQDLIKDGTEALKCLKKWMK